MFPSSLFEVEYARMRDVQDLAETGEYGDNVGPARKLARLSDLVGLGGGGSTFSKTEADGLYAPKTGSTEYATPFDVALGLAAKAEVGHTHSGLYQPWGDYLVAADIAGKADAATVYTKTQVDTAILTLQSQLNALIGEVSDKVDVALLQGYVQKTELPVVPDDGYATNTQLTNGLATKANQSYVDGKFSAQTTKESQQDGLIQTLRNEFLELQTEDWNPTLQLDPTTILGDGYTIIGFPNGVPKWTLTGTADGANNQFAFARAQVNTSAPLARAPVTPVRGLFAFRVATAAIQTAPLGIEQTRTVIPGRSYTFRTLMCRRDATNPLIKVFVLDATTDSIIAEISVNSFGLMADFAWRYWLLPFAAPASGQVKLRIHAHGAGNVVTLVYIAEAIVLRNN